jgi:hypothetical protein
LGVAAPIKIFKTQQPKQTMQQNHPFLKIRLLVLLFSTMVTAQPRKGNFISASIGLGVTSATYQEQDIGGTGFYAQGEYIHAVSDWFGIRPYAGIIITSPDDDETPDIKPDYGASTKAFLLGGKVRFCAPLPYVAPYLELGLGLSAGSFETYTPDKHIKKQGVIPHLPVSLGVAVGKKHGVDIMFTYYFMSSVEQFAGAGAVGIIFPLDKE